MNKDVSLNNISLKSIKPLLMKTQQILTKHAVFGAILVVLLAYVIVVLRINSLSSAEPTDDAQNTALAQTRVPRIDTKAIEQIQNLEQTNTSVRALFEHARNNPFQETRK